MTQTTQTICDRCGCKEDVHWAPCKVVHGDTTHYLSFDLCPKCKKEFEEFMEQGRQNG